MSFPDRAGGRPEDRFCLAVDLGTGGPKVGIVSLAGEVAWKDHAPVATRRLPDGGAVQDASEWWRLVTDAARRALGAGIVPAEKVVAVGVTGQWGSTVPVDAGGEPVGDCVLWQDNRGARYARGVIAGPVAGYAPWPAWQWIRRSGGAPSPNGGDPVGHMLFIERDLPEVAREARWYLEPVDYLTMRFTGRARASHASMIASWLTDNRRLAHYDYDPTLVRLAGVEATKLPPLVPTGSVVGTVADDLASDLGLPSGVQVLSGTPDLHSAACGAGAVKPFEAHVAISTSAWIGAPVPFKKTDVVRQVASVPGLDAKSYLIANNHETGGLCLEWLRDRMPGQPTYDELTALASTSPPGAGSALFTPWLNGERSPVDDQRARAGFHNLSLATTTADLARAVLEGVAYNARWLHDAVERFAGRRLDPVRIVGGGAVSDLWCQIHADVLDRTVERTSDPMHANLRGAAVFAGLALGAVRTEEVRALVGVEETFRPDPARRAVYDDLYAEFPGLYRAQRRMFARLNRG